jgi:hypothetical protein
MIAIFWPIFMSKKIVPLRGLFWRNLSKTKKMAYFIFEDLAFLKQHMTEFGLIIFLDSATL